MVSQRLLRYAYSLQFRWNVQGDLWKRSSGCSAEEREVAFAEPLACPNALLLPSDPGNPGAFYAGPALTKPT